LTFKAKILYKDKENDIFLTTVGGKYYFLILIHDKAKNWKILYFWNVSDNDGKYLLADLEPKK
jgi:hypothetical protein